MRDELPVLRHWPGRADPKPLRRGDRRAGGRGARLAGRRGLAGGREDLPLARRVSNVVFMGMGRRWPTTPPASRPCAGSSTPRRRASGCPRGADDVDRGLGPGDGHLRRRGLPVTLALSLHAPDDELRNELVPLNTRWPVAEVLDAAHRYFTATRRRVSIEYALIRDVNDQAWRADLLARELTLPRARLGARQPDPAQPDAGVTVDCIAPRRPAAVRRAARRGQHPTTVRDTRGRDRRACGRSPRPPS